MTDPMPRFHEWLDDAKKRGLPEPTAMALATANAQGVPTVRMVLLKAADARGFVFYTNLESDKASDLRDNPRAALCFFWAETRQVRVTGPVEPVSPAEADEYFASRARLARLGPGPPANPAPCRPSPSLSSPSRGSPPSSGWEPSRARPTGRASA